MQTSLWLLGAIATLATRAAHASTSQCSSISTCYKGGASSTPCSISSEGCPPCVTFADDGCYVKVNDACPFGVDCTSAWASSTANSADSSTSTPISDTTDSTTTTTSSGTDPSTTSDSHSTTNNSTDLSPNSTTSNSSGGSNNGAKEDSASGGSDMSVVFAIIGAAIGVIAVAIIFLTLVRRSKAAHDEDEDEILNTPVAFNKGLDPQNTTGAMYASYNNGNSSAGVNTGADTGVSANAMSYYNQQPLQNSSAPSPRVAGRAFPSQPVGLNQSTSNARTYGSSQNAGTPGVSVVSGMAASSVSGMTQAQPTPVQHPPVGGITPALQGRRESFEF